MHADTTSLIACVKYLMGNGSKNTNAYEVACRVREYGLPLNVCMNAMSKFWEPCFNLSPKEMTKARVKVESAYQFLSGDGFRSNQDKEDPDGWELVSDDDWGPVDPDGWDEVDSEEIKKPAPTPYLEKLKGAIKSSAHIQPAAIPRREWLVHGRFLRGFVTVTISPGGIGKSTMSILEGMAVAMDRGEDWLNRKTYGQEPVWIYNLEDPQEELDRRVAAVAQHYHVDLDKLPHLYTSSGLSLCLTIAREERGVVCISPRALQACEDFIREAGIKLWVIDPLVKAHLLNENDNGQMDRLMTELSKIATKTSCAIHLVHHSRKKMNDTGNGDADTARGASSVVNAARVAHTLNGMGAKEAGRYMLGEERKWYIRVDDAKANLTPPANKADWFKRVSVKLDNGDYVGVLQHADLSDLLKQQDLGQQIIDAVVTQMPNGHYPVQHMAELLALTGDFENENGREMTDRGIKKRIIKAFHNSQEKGGKAVKYEEGIRPRSGFRKGIKDWLVCEYSKELDSAIASGAVEANALEKAARLGKSKKGSNS